MGKAWRHLAVSPDLDEHRVWEEFVSPNLRDLPPNVRAISEYGFTEMLNNVLDHSESPMARVSVESEPRTVSLTVADDGVGIFQKIKREFHLEDEHQAVLELTKGKLTTDPERHTGEGIFFTARMFDEFAVISGKTGLLFRAGERDWWLEDRDLVKGTHISMAIDPKSPRTPKEVFDRFASEAGDFSFDSTVLAVRLVQPEGGNLVSRSQAKRLLARIEQFKSVVLDFKEVQSIGPAFADEIFRVFQNAHPGLSLSPVNANDDVSKMITRALRHGERPASPGGQ